VSIRGFFLINWFSKKKFDLHSSYEYIDLRYGILQIFGIKFYKSNWTILYIIWIRARVLSTDKGCSFLIQNG